MPVFEVEIQRTIYTTVGVDAADADAALAKVQAVRRSRCLRWSEWDARDGEEIIVRDEDGEEVASRSL